MKTFIGTKIIRGTPMTRQAYNDLRGWTVPADEDPTDEGYLVEYPDGGKPNVEGFEGYVSWSPKAQFEAAYIEIGHVTGLAPHQARVIGEKAELDYKRTKLIAFMQSPFFEKVEAEERNRLSRQLLIMDDYSAVLGERICRFLPPELTA